MKRVEPVSIGDAFDTLFKERDLSGGSVEGRAKELWKEVAGQYVAAATEDVYVRAGVIYVHFSSPAVRADVMTRRNFIIRELNAKLGGGKVIRSIVLK